MMLTAAVIGLGRLGREHAKNIMEIPHLKLVAVCDHTLTKARLLAQQLNISKYTDNTDHIMEDESIQAVIVVTQTNEHSDVILKAIAANKAIFVEKPLSINLEESLVIEQAVMRSNVYCQIGFMRRFDPDYVEAHRIISTGGIGKPLYFKGINRDAVSPSLKYIAKSGGIFVDLMIHEFDLARFLMHDEVESISAFGTNIKYPELETQQDVDQALSYLHFEKGAAGDIEGSRCAYYGYDVRTEIIGSEGSVFIGGNRQHHVEVLTKRGKLHTMIPTFSERFKSAFIKELTVFTAAVQENKLSPVTVTDSIKALRIAIAATESFKEQGKSKKVEQ